VKVRNDDRNNNYIAKIYHIFKLYKIKE